MSPAGLVHTSAWRRRIRDLEQHGAYAHDAAERARQLHAFDEEICPPRGPRHPLCLSAGHGEVGERGLPGFACENGNAAARKLLALVIALDAAAFRDHGALDGLHGRAMRRPMRNADQAPCRLLAHPSGETPMTSWCAHNRITR